MVDKTEQVKTSKSTAPYVLAAYAIGAFLTFGHVFNMNYVEAPAVMDCSKMQPYESDWLNCTNNNITARYSHSGFDATPPAFFAGIAWPIYWGGNVAIKVTK